MRGHLLLLSGLVLALAGCASSGGREYYQTRYIPTSSDVSYSATERAKWEGDLAVYELPDDPPALDGVHRARRPCVSPGPRFKPQSMVGYADRIQGGGGGELTALGAYDGRPQPLSAGNVATGYPVGVMASRIPPGGLARPNGSVPVAGWEGRPQAGASVHLRDGRPLAGMRDADKWDYCLPEKPLTR